MKTATLWAMCAAALASAAAAQESPSEVSDVQVMQYRFVAENTCRKLALAKGHTNERADAACACAFDTLVENMTHAEWQQAFFLSRRSPRGEEQQVFAPHLPKLARCRLR